MMPRQRVLIVDDSLTVRTDLAGVFEAAGFDPVACGSVTDARETLSAGAFALVVLDVLLPDGDGLELLNEIRGSANPRTPVMLLSTEAEVRDRIRGLQVGADEYVGKPYDPTYVVSRATELLRLRRSARVAGRPTVLVIDDSQTFRAALSEALEAAGYSVMSASSGEEGLRLAGDVRPAALVVDGVLPGIDGPTVIRHVRLDAALRRTPCLLLTASGEGRAELRALDAGADAFVRKEEDLAVILARFAAMLRAAPGGAAEPGTASLLGPKKILAVDDSLTYLHALADALREDGYDVILARSGEEALELLAVQPVDCILLDLLMPGVGGHETCRCLKAAPALRDIPLIMLTALDDRTAMIQGLGAGADDYISKSSDFDVLRARVRAQIRRRQFEDENRLVRERLLRMEVEAAEAKAASELAEMRAALVEELERKNRELEAFSYSVSHDLRAPLRGIDGFSQALLEDYAGKLDARGQDYLSRVRSAAQRMGELIDDLLQLSRAGRVALRRAPVDLSALAQAIASELHRTAPDRSVQFHVQDGLVVDADSHLLRLVMENLLGNAWKFTSTKPEAVVELGATRQDDQLVYFVRDNGVGFNMAYAGKLFAPFQRLHSDRQFPGTGIGLATVYRIIDRHGGRVWAQGAVGEGATFYWTLPAPRQGDQPSWAETTPFSSSKTTTTTSP